MIATIFLCSHRLEPFVSISAEHELSALILAAPKTRYYGESSYTLLSYRLQACRKQPPRSLWLSFRVLSLEPPRSFSDSWKADSQSSPQKREGISAIYIIQRSKRDHVNTVVAGNIWPFSFFCRHYPFIFWVCSFFLCSSTGLSHEFNEVV